MSITNPTRYLNLAVVLLYLAAMLLPVHRAAADAPQGACDGARTLPVRTGYAVAADEQVQFSNDLVDGALLEVVARQEDDEIYQAKMVILNEFGLELYKKNVANFDRIIATYDARLDRFFESNHPAPWEELDLGDRYDRVVHAMLNVALDTEELKHHVPAVWGSLMKENDAASVLGSNSRQIINSAMRYPMHNRIQKLFPQTLRAVRDCAATDPAFARAFDNTVGKKLGVGVRDSARTILQKRPDVVIPSQLEQLIEQNNGINLSLNELKEMSRAEFDKLYTAIDDMQQTLVEIDANQKVVVDWINDQEKQKTVQALAAAKAAEAQLTLAAFRSSISILSTLTGFLDPEFGEDFAVLGNAALDIGTAVQGLMTASAGLSALGDIASLGTVVMTGNVLGAVMNVVSLFGDDGPSPEQMILEEIGKLRQEVNQLRGEMHDRFDRIDEELNTIYTGMMERFDLIDIQLGKINGKLDVIQESLIALDLRLSRLERNTFELIDAVGRRPLLGAINGGLGYQERTGLPMPYQPEFVEFENTLHTWGTINAFDALAIGPSQRNYSPEALLAELNTYPMDANLNYLNGWLKANGMPGIANKVIASPRDWMLAARAYTQLGSEWPEHMQRINTERQAQLDVVGADIEMAMQNIAALTTVTGTVGNELLYTTVISYYQGRLDRLDSRIQPIEAAYVQEVQGGRLERVEPFNLCGGIDQPLIFQPPGLTMLSYDEDGVLPAPANLKAQITGLNRYTLAEYFTISPTQSIGMWMTGLASNVRPVPGCTPDPDVCPVMGDLKIFVRAAFGNVPLAQMELNAGRVTFPVIGGDLEAPTSYVARNWANLQPRFERDATPVPLTPDEAAQRARLYDELGSALETRLAGYQQEMYNRILTELNTGSLRQSATELAGGKALLDQLVTVGLARAVSNDDPTRSAARSQSPGRACWSTRDSPSAKWRINAARRSRRSSPGIWTQLQRRPTARRSTTLPAHAASLS
jgi:hypothetical protein